MPHDSLASWRDLYARAARARSWLEAHRWRYGPGVAQATVTDVREKLLLGPKDRVLEIGAGTGAFLMAVLQKDQSGVAVDICEALVQEGSRFGVDRSRIQLGVAEASRLPLPSESFDRVLCYSVAHHFPDQDYARHAILQLVRVCRVGGVVLIGDICGVMERYRRSLVRRGIPVRWVDGLLFGLSPVRQIRWLLARSKVACWSRTYRRSFFRKVLRNVPCEYEFLDQDIPDRKESLGRFDVRIRKTGRLGCIADRVAMVFVSASYVLEHLMAEWGSLPYG